MKVSAIQFSPIFGNKKENFSIVKRKVEKLAASSKKPDAIILPELWSTGYALAQVSSLATPSGVEEAEFLSKLALEYKIAFAGGSVLSQEKSKVYNRAQVIDENGNYVAGYNKIHLFLPMGEGSLGSGDSQCLFSLFGIKCSLAICYDLRFPETIRLSALGGAEMLFLAAEWPKERKEHWEILLKARAVENQMNVAACNRCGVEGETTFAGNSLLINAHGEVLAHGGSGECFVSAEFDDTLPKKLRQNFCAMQDRRPELYKGLVG